MIQQQRSATISALQDYTRLKRDRRRRVDERADIAWGLVLDSLIFNAEAEVRWLDHCEARLRRGERSSGPHAVTARHRPARERNHR